LYCSRRCCSPQARQADNWLTYQNDRYGTTIDYPDLFKMQRPPDSDDGREFKSADGADFTYPLPILRSILRSRNTVFHRQESRSRSHHL